MRPGQDRGSKGRGRCLRRQIGDRMVPLAGIEPALLAELDFESSASTNSATGARKCDLTCGIKAGQSERCEARPHGVPCVVLGALCSKKPRGAGPHPAPTLRTSMLRRLY